MFYGRFFARKFHGYYLQNLSHNCEWNDKEIKERIKITLIDKTNFKKWVYIIIHIFY